MKNANIKYASLYTILKRMLKNYDKLTITASDDEDNIELTVTGDGDFPLVLWLHPNMEITV